MYTLKAFRNSSTFQQTFTNKDAMLDTKKWLIANGFTIGTMDMHAGAPSSMAKVVGH